MRKRDRTIPPLGLLMVDVKEAAAMLHGDYQGNGEWKNW